MWVGVLRCCIFVVNRKKIKLYKVQIYLIIFPRDSMELRLVHRTLDETNIIWKKRKTLSRFAKKSLKVENFKHLFPLYEKQHDMMTRATMKYEVCKANSKRYQVSTIPHLQRLMNKEAQLKKIEFKKLKFWDFVTSYPCLIWGHLAVMINKFCLFCLFVCLVKWQKCLETFFSL